ncbi:MAG: pilin [Candidatus Saccharimonadales bacterium]
MACPTGGNGIINANNLPQSCANASSLNHLLTILFTIIGALAFLMLVIAGFRYVISQGEPQKMAEIRSQIIYIAIGLVLTGSADIIVTFILNRAG